MDNKLYWLWFENIKGFGKVKTNLLLDYFETPANVFHAFDQEVINFMKHYSAFRKEDMQNFVRSKDVNKIEKHYKEIIKSDINIVTKEEKLYPNKLRENYNPPNLLYYKGDMIKETSLNIGVVGARRCSTYGKNVAMKISSGLADNGINIISGMARGIDTHAHRGALQGKGRTVAVLGSGVNVCYPKENEKLMKEIIKHGCVVSEVPVNAAPVAGNFPMRNRIISGLCDGIIVVEAAKKSGSLITADMALEQGKDVFAIPGRISDYCSEGTNSLIKMGAKPITSIEDILEEYDLTKVSQELPDVELNDLEQRVFAVVEMNPQPIEKISRKTGIMIKDLQILLLKLELKGIVCRLANNMIVRL